MPSAHETGINSNSPEFPDSSICFFGAIADEGARFISTGQSYKGYYGRLLTFLSWFDSTLSRQIPKVALCGLFLYTPS